MLTLTNISKTFSGAFKPVLTQINLHLQEGDFCIVIGSNGSGKSTLIKIILGEYAPETGKIIIENDDLTKRDRSQAIASVAQDVNQGTIPEMTLLENMILSLSRTKKTGFSFYRRQAKQVTQKIKALGIGLEQYLYTPLTHLSGGQRQMVATIMAMTSHPKLLLLDEHTSALDPTTQRMVMAYTAEAIAEQQLTSLMITHNLADAINYGNRLIMLHEGQIVFDVAGEKKANLNVSELLALFHTYEDTALLEAPL
jgi:putative tryptophan/tyrosine transport system ATP-binding protein